MALILAFWGKGGERDTWSLNPVTAIARTAGDEYHFPCASQVGIKPEFAKTSHRPKRKKPFSHLSCVFSRLV